MNKHTMKSGYPVWQLPVKDNPLNSTGYFITNNAKYHCFSSGTSLCGKYWQDTDYFETDIESGEILSNPSLACKTCYRKWKANWLD